MDRAQAYQLDKGYGCYSDEDESGLYGVFGAESGFCYATYLDISDATEAACDLHSQLTEDQTNTGKCSHCPAPAEGPHKMSCAIGGKSSAGAKTTPTK